MSQPWIVIESISTDEGVLQLRRRGEGDFLITVGGLVLMNSRANRSELALGRLACEHLQNSDSRVFWWEGLAWAIPSEPFSILCLPPPRWS